eukprot:scaffold7349_cov173-Amphora_coffeaeformis.AAC.76
MFVGKARASKPKLESKIELAPVNHVCRCKDAHGQSPSPHTMIILVFYNSPVESRDHLDPLSAFGTLILHLLE